MPFTLAHPAAVLPLQRRFPQLDFAALVIGSLTPDFGYYLLLPDLRLETHSLLGSVETCLPAGVVLVLLFHWLKRPLRETLPQPHRAALLPLALRQQRLDPCGLLITALSVLLGVWTHLLWDAFTHRRYWGAQHLSVLRLELFTAAGKTYWVSDVLQWLGSVAGLAILLLAYRRWLRRQPTATAPANPHQERRRLLWLLGLALLAGAAALPFASRDTVYFTGLRAYAFQEWVHAAAFFGLTLSAYALLRRWIEARG